MCAGRGALRKTCLTSDAPASVTDERWLWLQSTQVLTPCRERDVVCTRLGDWSANGAETCTLAGFTAKADQGAGWCFDGRVPVPRRSSHKAASSSRPVLSFEGLRSAWVMSAGGACVYALLRLRSALRRSSRSGINVAREKAFLVRRGHGFYILSLIVPVAVR